MKNRVLPTPTNRFELLKDRLKTRFLDFIVVSLLVVVFLIPLIVWNMSLTYSKTFEVTQDNYLLMGLIIYAPYIVFIMIFGLGVVGALYYSKRLAFGEGANPAKDFFYGIKVNIKPALIAFFILGLIYFLMSFTKVTFYYTTSIGVIWKGVIMGFLYVAFMFIFMVVSFYLTQNIIYKGKTSQFFANAAKFTFGMIGWNFLILIIVLLPFFVYEFVPFALARYIAIAVSALFYFEFSIFVFSIYSHAIFDLTLNDNYPEIYRKGLTKEEIEE